MPHVSRMIVMPWACFSQAVTSLSAAACGAHETQNDGKDENDLFHEGSNTSEILLATQVKCDDVVAGAPGAAAADGDRDELFARREPIAHRRRLAAFRQAPRHSSRPVSMSKA